MVSRITELGSLYRSRSGLWAPYYSILQQELGATATLMDFGNQGSAGKVNATTWTGRSFSATGLAPTWTPSEALSAFDTPFDLTKESNWLGMAPILTMNGSDEQVSTPDAAYWTTVASSAFSVGAWVKASSVAADGYFLSKYPLTTGAEAREWSFYMDVPTGWRLIVYDESADASVSRRYSVQPTAGQWYFVVATYNGGTTDASIVVYQDGAAVDDTDVGGGVFVSMEDLTGLVYAGAVIGTGGTAVGQWNGKMLGGPWSPFFVQVALTAAQVKNLFSNMRLGLGI